MYPAKFSAGPIAPEGKGSGKVEASRVRALLVYTTYVEAFVVKGLSG
jgi:hypothetical protein